MGICLNNSSMKKLSRINSTGEFFMPGKKFKTYENQIDHGFYDHLKHHRGRFHCQKILVYDNSLN